MQGGFSKEERRLALMAALLLPLRAATAPLKGAKTQPLTSHLLLHGIKWRTSDADCIDVVHREAGVLLEAFHQLQVGSLGSNPACLMSFVYCLTLLFSAALPCELKNTTNIAIWEEPCHFQCGAWMAIFIP